MSPFKTELERAEARWAAADQTSYELHVSYSEFALQYGCEAQHYSVKNGRSEFIPTAGCELDNKGKAAFGTVPLLFAFMRRLITNPVDAEGNVEEVKMSFDPALGYPTTFYVGSKRIEDAYFSFKAVVTTRTD